MPKKSTLGKSLIKNKNKQQKSKSYLHTTEGPKIQSVIDQNDIEEFMSLAQMSNRQFQAERQMNLVSETRLVSRSTINTAVQGQTYTPLQLPKRPKWDSSTTAEQLQELEHNSFLEWRRQIAETEENSLDKAVTPFEKNLDMWRQLWRVLERSNAVCQIVDARNPLFFRSPDLEQYISELGKKFVVVLNKADLVDKDTRLKWAEYFAGEHLEVVWFSATTEQELIDEGLQKDSEFGESFNSDPAYIHSSSELLEKLSRDFEGHLTIGFVGYPNVGKSSVINVICGQKRVAVAAQPGKTKHLQSLELSEKVSLCDCPGLVFPSVLSSRAEMVTCGVLPIDNLKDVISPVEILCLRVHSSQFEKLYGIQLGGRVEARELLGAIGTKRGYFTGRGLPNENKVARKILKDYVKGKLLYCHLPPGHETPIEEPAPQKPVEVDEEFFAVKAEPALKVESDGVTYEGGFKLTKQDKRELKFAARRGEDLNHKLKEMQKKKEGQGFNIRNRNHN